MSEQFPGILARPFGGDADFWRVRELLSASLLIAPVGLNWDVRRWDGKRFYAASGTWSPDWPARVRLWETQDGQLVAAVNPEGQGDAHLQVHPDYRHLEVEMMGWAEKHLSVKTAEGASRQLHLFAYEYDVLRQGVLSQRGYERTRHGGVIRHLRLGHQPLELPQVAEGYRLRSTRPEDIQDCQRIADLLNAAFGRDFHTAQEYQMFTQLAPCFRQELDLVMESPDGSLAAYVGVCYDDVNGRGIFEPVCTHPDHRRRGLGQALMREGLLRLKALGAQDVVVETGDMIPANRLYASIGFTEAYAGHHWRRVW